MDAEAELIETDARQVAGVRRGTETVRPDAVRGEEHPVEPMLADEPTQLGHIAQDRQSTEATPPQRRVVVDEPHRPQVQGAVSLHLAQRQLAARPGPVHRDAASVLGLGLPVVGQHAKRRSPGARG